MGAQRMGQYDGRSQAMAALRSLSLRLWPVLLGSVFWLSVGVVPLFAQDAAPTSPAQLPPSHAAPSDSASKTPAPPAPPAEPTVGGTELDRVVAIVNGDLVLDSDVVQELQFEDFQPISVAGKVSREGAIGRLINRDLILQQARLLPDEDVTDAAVAKELDKLRKTLPECRKAHCETEAGWDKFLASHGFTQKTFADRWKQRMQVLGFIEDRFRMGIKIPSADIKKYYETNMLPRYKEQGVQPPKLDAISDRIQELLLEQQVSSLLGDWLKSLRAQGSVVVLHPGEEAP